LVNRSALTAEPSSTIIRSSASAERSASAPALLSR
jgi:hypothetical protein